MNYCETEPRKRWRPKSATARNKCGQKYFNGERNILSSKLLLKRFFLSRRPPSLLRCGKRENRSKLCPPLTGDAPLCLDKISFLPFEFFFLSWHDRHVMLYNICTFIDQNLGAVAMATLCKGWGVSKRWTSAFILSERMRILWISGETRPLLVMDERGKNDVKKLN